MHGVTYLVSVLLKKRRTFRNYHMMIIEGRTCSSYRLKQLDCPGICAKTSRTILFHGRYPLSQCRAPLLTPQSLLSSDKRREQPTRNELIQRFRVIDEQLSALERSAGAVASEMEGSRQVRIE